VRTRPPPYVARTRPRCGRAADGGGHTTSGTTHIAAARKDGVGHAPSPFRPATVTTHQMLSGSTAGPAVARTTPNRDDRRSFVTRAERPGERHVPTPPVSSTACWGPRSVGGPRGRLAGDPRSDVGRSDGNSTPGHCLEVSLPPHERRPVLLRLGVLQPALRALNVPIQPGHCLVTPERLISSVHDDPASVYRTVSAGGRCRSDTTGEPTDQDSPDRRFVRIELVRQTRKLSDSVRIGRSW
jgi:hypothetical protein